MPSISKAGARANAARSGAADIALKGTLLPALLALGLAACGEDRPADEVPVQSAGMPASADAPREAPEAADRIAAMTEEAAPAPAVAEEEPEARIARAAAISTARIEDADREPGNWLSHGRTYSEQRFSPLDQIDTENVERLGLAWYIDLRTERGLEATPIVSDGVMFFTGAWSVVWAVDARTGEELWYYDPEVPRRWGQIVCCDVVNRGAAVYDGAVIFGTIDGRLISLDAATGEPNWEVVTVDQDKEYSITGAPRVVDGKVFIGNGGGEFGVRGYFSAYDVKTGDMLWRFFTVPGNPEDGFEHPELEMAAETWTGEWWEIGGGGTVWDSFAYDPELDLLYVGTGNGSPWARHVRSPEGGDNLFLSSILAVKPETGELVWHYQTTPADNWDYTATQHMILADMEIGGEMRQVIMQAPKNGFFYVLDRKTGELISAENFVEINWASHVDMETGRPVETGAGSYEDEAAFVIPGPSGAHNWQPMAYSPRTNLVYIPAMDTAHLFEPAPEFQYLKGWWNTGGINTQTVEPLKKGDQKGRVIAWDPVKQEKVWSYEHYGPWNGGLLATAGDLVFQGASDGLMRAFAADTGEMLWSAPANTGVIAPPISYAVDGEQYIAVVAGWGGSTALFGGDMAAPEGIEHEGRLLVFKLGGEESLPPQRRDVMAEAPPPMPEVTPAAFAEGKVLFHNFCHVCHGVGAVGGGVIPDLRYSSSAVHENWNEIVLEGMLTERGMGGFGEWLTEEQAAAIHAYVISRAHERPGLTEERAPEAGGGPAD